MEVAIKLFDKAMLMKIPARIESSMVFKSDSRYVILYPGQINQATIRISSHRPHSEQEYALAINIQSPERLATAAEVGIKWLEENYAHNSGEDLSHGKNTVAEISDERRSGDGPRGRAKRGDFKKKHRRSKNRSHDGDPDWLRDAGSFAGRAGLERHLRNKWPRHR